MKETYIWIARDRDYYEDVNDYPTPGRLKMFYDTPLRDGDKWGFAREICELPSYMYPEITWESGAVKFVSDVGQISDGYHTFDELYEYRLLYNAALFNELAEKGGYNVHKSKRHSDGEIPFGDPNWFIVMATLPTGQISNHYEMKDWDLFKVPEKYTADVWDGHTPKDVANRLRKFLKK